MTRSASVLVLAICLLAPLDAIAQEPAAQKPNPDTANADARSLLSPEAFRRAVEPLAGEGLDRGPGQGAQNDRRACDGCPKRSVGRALLWTTYVNVFYGLGNLARGEETAKVTPKTWWANMKAGFEWDANPFLVNQFGHPYQGNNYFNVGRANGLSFWESSALTAFGSATWEYFGETNSASFNDLINTTLGGIALGEMFHRTAWLIRNPHATGKSRLWSEIGAMVVDPMTGLERFISGDSSRISEKPVAPESLGATASAGVLWQGSDLKDIDASGVGFLDADVRYGDLRAGRSRTPYEAFGVHFRLGGGSAISEVKVLGRLLGQPYGEGGKHQFTIFQTYDYTVNGAYSFGAQGFQAGSISTLPLSKRTGLVLGGWGGVTVLGAVDRLGPTVAQLNTEEEEGERTYDYGPGSTFGGIVRLLLNDRNLMSAQYQGYQIYVMDGLRANHVLQRLDVMLDVPVHKHWAVGTAGEFFYRKTYFNAGGEQTAKFWQFRTYLTWRKY